MVPCLEVGDGGWLLVMAAVLTRSTPMGSADIYIYIHTCIYIYIYIYIMRGSKPL